MADSYWNRPPQPQPQQPPPMYPPSSGMLKRPRSEYDIQPAGMPTAGNEMQNYMAPDDRSGTRVIKDTKTIGSAYDRYLQNTQLASFSSGEASTYGAAGMGRPAGSAMTGRPMTDSAGMAHPGAVGPDHIPMADPSGMARPGAFVTDRLPMADPPGMARTGAVGPDLVPNGRNMGYGGQLPMETMPRPGRETAPLPPDASSTLYVEGLPPDSTRREVAHIFRPFVGYKEVRLVTKESKHRGGDPLILCFVDFATPACAATAMSALQGYKMDEHDPDSAYLRLQFSRFPGPRSGPGSRGKR